MRIMMFSKAPLFPTLKGNRRRQLTLCNQLTSMGHEVKFVLLPARQMQDFDREAHLNYFGANLFHHLQRSRLRAVRFETRLLRFLLRRKIFAYLSRSVIRSSDVDIYFDTSLLSSIKQLMSQYSPQIVIVEYVNCSAILDVAPPGVFKIIDTHDEFSHIFTAEAEKKGLSRAHSIIAIQEEEAKLFRTLLQTPESVSIISHITADPISTDLSKPLGATFIGANFDANNRSVDAFIRVVLPIILAKKKSFKLYVAGTVCETVPDHPAIVKLGIVSSVADAFAAAPILINYIKFGTGIKIKLLDSMALGIPTVSTEFGVKGVQRSFLRGATTVPDNDPQAFADAVLELLADRELREALGRRAAEDAARWNEAQKATLAALLEDAKDLVFQP